MKILSFLYVILDFVAPKRPRALLLDDARAEDVAVLISVHECNGVSITSLTKYRSHLAESMVRALKYDRSQRAALLLASILADYLQEALADQTVFGEKPIFLCAVPLHALRERERGFNQIELVFEEVSKLLPKGSFRVTRALTRTRNTPPQTRLSRRERLQNVVDAFEAKNAPELEDARVYLVDDVTTTGATLSEAARELEKTGAEVEAIAFARS